MTRAERARLRLEARRYAYDFLRVKRLPRGVPAIVRAYADSFTEYPYPHPLYDTLFPTSPMTGLRWQLLPFRKVWFGA